MATAEIKAVITAEDKASATVANFGKNVGKTSAGVGIAIAAMGTAAIAFGVQSVNAFAESERATTQLDKVLRSTGGAAGITRDAALDLADSLMHLTGIDDDAILSAENMLLTFTKLSKEEFPNATKTILDTATAMNGGLKPSAEELRNQTIQLGKALQDPDAGLGALKRVGVNVDELSAKFTDAMPIQEKQRLILQELGTEFGGSADKTNSFSDKLLTLQTNLGNLQEKIGGLIATALSPLIEKLNSWVDNNPQMAEKIGITTLAVGSLTAGIWALNTALSVLGGIFNSVLGRFGLIAAGITFLYLQFKTAADATNNLNDRLSGFYNWMMNARQATLSAAGPFQAITQFIYNVDSAFLGASRSIDEFIRKIPLVGGLLGATLPKLPSLNIPGRAVGGPVSSGAPYIVGEKGPELFVPNGSGTIIPNGSPISQSSNTTININVGLMTGSAIERREAAAMMFEDLKDIASQRGQTVGQMVGA